MNKILLNLLNKIQASNEPLLAGVYGTVDNFKSDFRSGIKVYLLSNKTPETATTSALANKWSVLYANNRKLLLQITNYVTAETKNVIEIPKHNIRRISLKMVYLC